MPTEENIDISTILTKEEKRNELEHALWVVRSNDLTVISKDRIQTVLDETNEEIPLRVKHLLIDALNGVILE